LDLRRRKQWQMKDNEEIYNSVTSCCNIWKFKWRRLHQAGNEPQMRKNKKCVHKFDRKTFKTSPLLRLKSGWKIPHESIELGLEDVTALDWLNFLFSGRV